MGQNRHANRETGEMNRAHERVVLGKSATRRPCKVRLGCTAGVWSVWDYITMWSVWDYDGAALRSMCSRVKGDTYISPSSLPRRRRPRPTF